MRLFSAVALFARRIARTTTIRVRLTLWYVLLLAVILAALSAVLYVLLDNGLDGQVDTDLRAASEQALGAIGQQGGQLVVQTTDGESELSSLAERGILARVIGLDGKVVTSLGPFSTLPVSADSSNIAGQRQPHFDNVTLTGDGTEVRVYTVPYQEAGHVYGFVQVGQSLKPAQDTLHQLWLIMIFVMPAVLILASIGGLFLSNRALSPINHITQAARRISAEDLTRRLELDLPDDEVGRLARTFDTMLGRLEEAFERQRQFTSDASHELRTPLTIMKGDIGVTLNRSRSVDEYRSVLAGLEEEVDRLTRLVDDLLLLARADSTRPLLHIRPIDLSDLLTRVADQVRPMSDAKGQAVELSVPVELSLQGDQDKLLRLFLNLLDNAIKYTPDGGLIRVRVASSDPRSVVVEVEDNGPGIPPQQMDHIFERFFRVDSARSRSHGGAGLGLSIAEWICHAHGGYISVRSELGEGSIFSVWLPRDEAQAISEERRKKTEGSQVAAGIEA